MITTPVGLVRSFAAKTALLLFTSCALVLGSAAAATYYVVPTGNDANDGSEAAPFQSLAQAQAVASDGDTVLMRGGTYNTFTIAATDNNYHYVHVLNKSGITYAAYPGEVPVFDFSAIPTDRRVCGFRITATVTIIGMQVTGTPVGTQKQSENFRIDGSRANATFIDCVCHDTQANGFYFTNHGGGSCTNCDAYNNIGLRPNSVGNTDGFGAHGRSVVFSYCRSWHNSDDGYDCISSDQGASHTFDHCWAYNMTAGGDSNGFKIGGYGTGTVPATVPVHTVRYCLAANNNAHGFYANHQPGQAAVWTHNTSFNNAAGDFDMLERVSVTNPTDIPGYREVLHYNLGYLRQIVRDDADPATSETSNSWTLPVTVDAGDFESTDPTQITRPRGADFSMPEITFMHLVPGSDLMGLGCFDGPPAAPTNLVATAASDTSIRLTWTAPAGATAYDIKRSTTAGGPYTTVATGVTDTEYVDMGLTTGVKYYYVVAAVRGWSEEGDDSAEASAYADVTPPSIISITASRATLWPVNHRLTPVDITVNATDNGTPSPVSHIVSVSSNQPDNGTGDGNTTGDWAVTGPLSVQLRAERSGNDGDRVYTITVECTDEAGNSSEGTVAVTVPHNE